MATVPAPVLAAAVAVALAVVLYEAARQRGSSAGRSPCERNET